MKKQIFRGCGTALVTPMDKDGNIDFKAMERLLDYQLSHHIDAVIVNGTTGESVTQEDREKLQVMEFVITYVNGRVPVIAGTGSNCTAHAVQLSKAAEKLGADGLLQVTPYYNKTSRNGLVAHFTAVADCVDIPVILYNVPSRTGVNIAPETYQILAEHPNICGAKEASGNISQIAKIAALCGENFAVYSGNDDQTLPILALGGVGVISVLSNIMPEEMHRLCRTFFHGEVEESRKIQLSLLKLMNAMFSDVNPIPVKAALSMMGICEESYRMPLTAMDEEKKKKLEDVMREYKLLK